MKRIIDSHCAGPTADSCQRSPLYCLQAGPGLSVPGGDGGGTNSSLFHRILLPVPDDLPSPRDSHQQDSLESFLHQPLPVLRLGVPSVPLAQTAGQAGPVLLPGQSGHRRGLVGPVQHNLRRDQHRGQRGAVRHLHQQIFSNMSAGLSLQCAVVTSILASSLQRITGSGEGPLNHLVFNPSEPLLAIGGSKGSCSKLLIK